MTQLYTVLRPSGEVECEGRTLEEAAKAIMTYDGHEFEVHENEYGGFDLWVSRFSRNSTAYRRLTRSSVFSPFPDRKDAEADIQRIVVANAGWWGLDAMTDEEYAEYKASYL